MLCNEAGGKREFFDDNSLCLALWLLTGRSLLPGSRAICWDSEKCLLLHSPSTYSNSSLISSTTKLTFWFRNKGKWWTGDLFVIIATIRILRVVILPWVESVCANSIEIYMNSVKAEEIIGKKNLRIFLKTMHEFNEKWSDLDSRSTAQTYWQGTCFRLIFKTNTLSLIRPLRSEYQFYCHQPSRCFQLSWTTENYANMSQRLSIGKTQKNPFTNLLVYTTHTWPRLAANYINN